MTEARPLVHLVDDHRAVQSALAVTIRLMGLDAACYSSGTAFLEQYQPSRVGCLVLDLWMPQMSGLEVLEELASRRQRIPTVMISACADVAAAVQAMKVGAIDFLEKPYSVQAFTNSVSKAIALSQQQHRREAERIGLQARLDTLTPQERQVLELTMAGEPDKVIAAQGDCSIRTVQLRRARIMQKLEVASRVELLQKLHAANPGCEF